MVESAVTFGRYNLFTYGHISTIIEILKEYKRINIGLIINDEKSRIQIDKNLKEFYKLADKNYTDIITSCFKRKIYYGRIKRIWS